MVSFTIPLNGYTIVVTTCSSSADGPGSAAPIRCGSVCVTMSCCSGFLLLMVLTVLFGTR